ncbi:MAG: amidase [Rhodospirillales bacterium]|nr:amidase [Rhodospirillales bacterium]MDH3968763.1 amidase [Rhodospirillales bacterium]
MATDELAYLDATSQAELVRRQEVKPTELVEAAIERVERLNGELNAVITPMFELAREAAADRDNDKPFNGIPFLLKDLVAEYAGVRLSEGSAYLADFIPEQDSELVIRLKKSGLVIIGKSNTCEFGLLPVTEPSFFGPTRNPWDMELTAGGSSGGSAAAVAAGLVPMAHGNDGGGSIRIPASCCGVFGLKPSRGRNPLGPLFGDTLSGLVAEHALTRSVRDSAALLDATSGPDLGDPYWTPPPSRPFLQEVSTAPGCLRIGYTTKAPGGAKVSPECIEAVTDAAKLCEELGHTIEVADAALNPDIPIDALDVLWCGAAAWVAEHWTRRTGRPPSSENVEPLTWTLIGKGRQYSAGDYMLAVEDLQRFAREVARRFDPYDVCLRPTLAEPPIPLGSFECTPEEPLRGWIRAGDFAPFSCIENITGQPAMSVPLYWSDEGLPIGSQFSAKYGDEATLFRLAGRLEEARPWIHRRPPMAAKTVS